MNKFWNSQPNHIAILVVRVPYHRKWLVWLLLLWRLSSRQFKLLFVTDYENTVNGVRFMNSLKFRRHTISLAYSIKVAPMFGEWGFASLLEFEFFVTAIVCFFSYRLSGQWTPMSQESMTSLRLVVGCLQFWHRTNMNCRSYRNNCQKCSTPSR